MIFLRIKIELIILLRVIYVGSFVKTASDEWLDNKASDYGKFRKEATKTKGVLTITKIDEDIDLIIPKGYVFKTSSNLAGKEYRFLSTEKNIIPAGQKVGQVPIIAEDVGAAYNVPKLSINQSLVHIENVEKYENLTGWITREGSDREDDESFRNRTLNVWAELSTQPTALKYKNVAESVDGVLYAIVDDMHPRGQGTIDIIIATQNGSASEKLLLDVSNKLEEIKGVYDDVLVKSATVENVDINLILYIDYNSSEQRVVERAVNYTKEYFKISNKRKLNTFYLSELIFHIRKNIDELTAVKIIEPTTDLTREKNIILTVGEITAKIERV